MGKRILLIGPKEINGWLLQGGKKQSGLSGEHDRTPHDHGLEVSSHMLAITLDGTGEGPPPPSEHLGLWYMQLHHWRRCFSR